MSGTDRCVVGINRDMTRTGKLDILTSEIETPQPCRIPYTTEMNIEPAQPAPEMMPCRWGTRKRMKYLNKHKKPKQKNNDSHEISSLKFRLDKY